MQEENQTETKMASYWGRSWGSGVEWALMSGRGREHVTKLCKCRLAVKIC